MSSSSTPPANPSPAPRRRRGLHLPGRARYPVWSVRTIALLATLVIALAAGLIFFLGRRSVLVEAEWTLTAVAACLFVFLSVGLYRGARVRRRDVPELKFEAVEIGDVGDVNFNIGDMDCPFDADEGCLGAIVGLLLSVVVLAALVFLLWLLLNVAVGVFVVLSLAIYWVLFLALRQVFARSRRCRGQLAPSLAWAAVFTALYTGWLFALMLLAAHLNVTAR